LALTAPGWGAITVRSKHAAKVAPSVAPTPPKPAPNVETPEGELKLRRVWFGIVTKRCDRSEQGFVAAIRKAFDDLAGVSWNSPADMCDGMAEHIRKTLNGPRDSIEVDWVGARKSANATRFVIKTAWHLREDIEHTMAFALFAASK
jgi:hypothetical protein